MDMRKALLLCVTILMILVILEAAPMAGASNPMCSTTIKSPTNRTYNTNLIVLETLSDGLSGKNIYYTFLYSVDGKANVTLPVTTESHEKSFQITMRGAATLPELSWGPHNLTVYQKVEADSTPPMLYWDSYVVNFTVCVEGQNSQVTPPSNSEQTIAVNNPSNPIMLTTLAFAIAAVAVVTSLIIFVKQKRKQ
ncbi:MAG: hypothetical protein NWE92_04575 [Candidatus Bathyarchaeota archaeon]|nr:hypothetical protein [Candidatus Bathyarchaeota archaeon]